MNEMDENVSIMYEDALVLESISVLEHEAALNNASRINRAWSAVSAGLQKLIARLGRVDMKAAESLLEAWRNVGEKETDFRRLSAGAVSKIRPLVLEALNKLYQPMEADCGRWKISQTESRFLTVFDTEKKRYIHSPSSPIREAAILADSLYNDDMESFHMLGCGLGYLPYELWIKSEKTLKIYIYETDNLLRQLAYNIGVLNWIDKENIVMVDCENADDMLQKFLLNSKSEHSGYYVQDWKEGEYREFYYGKYADKVSCNMRMNRIYSAIWQANKRSNNKQTHFSMLELKKREDLCRQKYAVVSAGPSLDENIDFLKDNSEEICVIAVNAALRRLVNEGIKVDIVTMLDPLPAIAGHLEGIVDHTEGIPLVTVDNGSRTFISAYKGPMYFVGDALSDGYEWGFEGTVASLALDLAYYLNAKKVYLIGSDLGFPMGKNYAGGVAHKVDEGMPDVKLEELVTEAVDGNIIQTTVLYESYRRTLEDQIQNHPGVEVYNMSRHGAKISGTIPIA